MCHKTKYVTNLRICTYLHTNAPKVCHKNTRNVPRERKGQRGEKRHRQSDINMSRAKSNELAKGNRKTTTLTTTKTERTRKRANEGKIKPAGGGSEKGSGTICGKFLLTRRELGNRAY